jgi:hypothetical protein
MSQRNVKGGISFELRKYAGGRWMLDSVYDDKDLATTEAKSLIEHFRTIPAVRVIAVAEEDGQFREWTVFKQGMTDDQQAVARTIAPRPAAPPAAPSVAQTREMPVVDRPKRRRISGRRYYARLAGGMLIVFGAAMLGIAVLRMIS